MAIIDPEETKKSTQIAVIIIVIGLMAVATICFAAFNKSELSVYTKNCFTQEIVDMQEYILFVQTGCPHCERQLDELDGLVENLTIINCVNDGEVCFNKGITSVPTLFNNETNAMYKGFNEFSFVKNLVNKTISRDICQKANETESLIIEKTIVSNNESFSVFETTPKEELTIPFLDRKCDCTYCKYITQNGIKEYFSHEECNAMKKLDIERYSCYEWDCGINIVEYS